MVKKKTSLTMRWVDNFILDVNLIGQILTERFVLLHNYSMSSAVMLSFLQRMSQIGSKTIFTMSKSWMEKGRQYIFSQYSHFLLIFYIFTSK